jgi:hypothetical protein
MITLMLIDSWMQRAEAGSQAATVVSSSMASG